MPVPRRSSQLVAVGLGIGRRRTVSGQLAYPVRGGLGASLVEEDGGQLVVRGLGGVR